MRTAQFKHKHLLALSTEDGGPPGPRVRSPCNIYIYTCFIVDVKYSAQHQSGSTAYIENGLARAYKTCELATIPMADQEQLSVQIDLNTLRGATHEQKVPVSLFVLCKAIVEDEGGALFLDATVVQRVQVGNVPVPDTLDPTSEKSTAEHLKALMFDIGLKGPFPGGEVKIRRDATLTGVGAQPDSTKLCAQTSNLVSVPIDVRSIWHW